MKKKSKLNNEEKQYIVIISCVLGITFILLGAMLVTYINRPDYKEIDYEQICHELSKTNEYLIKSCHENGGEIKIIYDETNEYIKEISCVR